MNIPPQPGQKQEPGITYKVKTKNKPEMIEVCDGLPRPGGIIDLTG